MKKLDEFLEVIDEGDAVNILSEDGVVEKFNESLKHDLVKVEEDKVSLTSKGKRARDTGTKEVIGEDRQKNEPVEEFDEEGRKRVRLLAATVLAITLLVLLLTVWYIL